jgi:hypothetical protein
MKRKHRSLPGKRLGGMRQKSLETQREARERAEQLPPIFTELAHLSANALARELNARCVPTPTGKSWSPVMVIRVRNRLEAAQ